MKDNLLRVKVKMGDREVEISYPLTERNAVEYPSKGGSTMQSAVNAIKDIVEKLKEK